MSGPSGWTDRWSNTDTISCLTQHLLQDNKNWLFNMRTFEKATTKKCIMWTHKLSNQDGLNLSLTQCVGETPCLQHDQQESLGQSQGQHWYHLTVLDTRNMDTEYKHKLCCWPQKRQSQKCNGLKKYHKISTYWFLHSSTEQEASVDATVGVNFPMFPVTVIVIWKSHKHCDTLSMYSKKESSPAPSPLIFPTHSPVWMLITLPGKVKHDHLLNQVFFQKANLHHIPLKNVSTCVLNFSMLNFHINSLILFWILY